MIFSSPSIAESADDQSSWRDRFELHGHFSTAYAESTSAGLSGELGSDRILGLSEDGTFEYRNAALQARYRISDRHKFVLQLSHQKLGDSVIERVMDAVEVDWLFWDWQIGPETRFRLGRLPTPAGIYNEVRDVGTVLPFFRPAFNFYREGSLFSETVDGAGLTHRFFAESPWSLEASIYAGEFEIFEQSAGIDNEFTAVDASGAIGTQLWLETPIDGLRVGVGTLRWDVSEKSQFNSTETTWESWYASLEANFEKWVFRAEHRVVDLPFETTLGPTGEAEVTANYAQLGWRPTEKLSFYVQNEFTDIHQVSDIYLDGSFELDERDDLGFAVNFALRPTMILKAEYHQQDFEVSNVTPVFTPQGLRLLIDSTNVENEYFIAGFAVSF